MAPLLSTLISDRPTHKSSSNFILVQSSPACSAFSIIKCIIREARTNGREVIVIRSLFPEHLLLVRDTDTDNEGVKIIDWSADVPGFGIDAIDWELRLVEVKTAVDSGLAGRPFTVVFDSLDVLEDDFESISKAYSFLAQVLAHLTASQHQSTLVLHLNIHSKLLPLLQQPSFSPSLVHLSAHPPQLLTHIASEFLLPPPLPPSSSSPPTDPSALKFWDIFIRLTQPSRAGDVDALVFGQREQPAGTQDEIVVEVLIRSLSGELSTIGGASAAMHSHARRRAVNRVLEGWKTTKREACSLDQLVALKSIWRRNIDVEKDVPDPTKNLTFNLNLTESQQSSKSKVRLPYEHEGKPSEVSHSRGAQIMYDPDSADDLDDDDPDEDLDI